tara:strand:- start:1560 stop:1796 length:237 start_codon:yes stop_codon:yes gene_type:complete
MADKDVSRLVVERTSQIIGRLRTHFSTHIPYGPKKERLTLQEARLRIQGMDPASKAQLQERMGPAEWDAYMDRLYRDK